MSISNRERYKAIARFQRPGDLFMEDMIYVNTVENWVKQGAPEQMLDRGTGVADFYGNSFLKDYFKHDNKITMWGVKSGVMGEDVDTNGVSRMYSGSPLVPNFEIKTIAEDERTTTFVNASGQTQKKLKSRVYGMPMFIDWPVKDRASWNELKKRLDPNTPERWPANWDAYVKKMNGQDDPLIMKLVGFYGPLRDWVGSKNILYMFYDDPGLIEDMMEHILYLETEMIKRVVKDIKVDEADYWEDMAYKAGPLISPDMMRKFMMPRYRKITDLLHSHGIDIIYVDCDGNIEQLIPLWLEVGINYMWPIEQAAGNDAVALRKKYGKDLILGGGIDKRALIKGKEAIRAEVMSKVPFLLEQGGYFPTVDHSVGPDISFENYCYYVNTMREAAGLEKLSF
jgi:hypothetical protein